VKKKVKVKSSHKIDIREQSLLLADSNYKSTGENVKSNIKDSKNIYIIA